MNSLLHVAAAVITDEHGKVLLAKRAEHVHQGGLWEFPGGKVEEGERVEQALVRELQEELGIIATEFRPLIRVTHNYGDRKVLLDVWLVSSFKGVAHGAEGQEVRWVDPDELETFRFPSANRPIVMAVRLPDSYLITPEPGQPQNWHRFLERLDASIRSGLKLVQFRAKELNPKHHMELAERVLDLCKTNNCKVLLNGTPDLAMTLGYDGVHLNSDQLQSMGSRSIPNDKLMSASCHNSKELNKAREIGCDFAVLGPIKPTLSHPGATTMGWENFERLTLHCDIPVYALGGMTESDYKQAWGHGAQGIAAIRALWRDKGESIK